MKLVLVTKDGQVYDVLDEADNIEGYDLSMPMAQSTVCEAIQSEINRIKLYEGGK